MRPHATPGVAWAARSRELARWAWERLVNRTDVWGGYTPVGDREKVITRPDGSTYKLGATLTRPALRDRGRVSLTEAVLARHFRATSPADVVGLHTTSPENTSRWGTVETDWHGPESTGPETNWRATRALYDRLVARHFRPLLTDSNGKGGFHLDVLLAEAVPTPRMFHFLRGLVKDHASLGLPCPPECFPKQPQLRPREGGGGRCGNWVRVVGRHHTREHWSRVWDGERWLAGGEAIGFILSLTGDPAWLIPPAPGPALTVPQAAVARPRRSLGALRAVRGGATLSDRIAGYLRRLPNLGEGQGRDDVAYRFACFLVRDLGVSDTVALEWLSLWDAGNRPPKGRERLAEVLANALTYGRNPVGCALPPAAAPPALKYHRPAGRSGHWTVSFTVEL
jgi:hypothetical protein